MVKSEITSRLSSIKAKVILTQTDTTVGFISQNKDKLYEIKARDTSKEFIKVYSSFREFTAPQGHLSLRSGTCGNRIPTCQKNLVRRSKKTTFIVKNRAFRIAKNFLNSNIFRNIKWNYSTSANEAGKKFSREFCEYKADIIIEDKNRLNENSSSTLLKINNIKKVRLR
ncbi:hypothetical protein [Sulfurimonas sp.]